MRIVLIGRPGSGKGTQAKCLHDLFGMPIVSVGEIFREQIARGTALGEAARRASLRGGLVDDSLTVDLVRDALGRIDPREGFLLDGYPRTVAQAAELEEMLGDLKAPLHLAIEIAVREEVAFERVSRRSGPRRSGSDRCEEPGRIDDAEQIIRARMQGFSYHIPSLRTFYGDLGLLCSVDGNWSIRSVSLTLEDAIRSRGANPYSRPRPLASIFHGG